MAETPNNPLIRTDGLPQFNAIETEHIIPGLEQVIDQTINLLKDLEDNMTPTWEGLLHPMELMDIPFEYAWQPVNHLLNVKNSKELREKHQEILPKLVELGLRISQSQTIYKGLKALRESSEWDNLASGQQRVIKLKLRAAMHAGVGLEGADKERFAEISRELSQLNTTFSNNVLDATKAFELIITDSGQTEGWPTSLKQISAHSYAQAKEAEQAPNPENGPWRITLDYPSFVPFMQHSQQRDQREHVYRAFVTRASSGEQDNLTLIDRILELRSEKAALLGFPNYAALSLDAKMADSVQDVEKMTDELKSAAREFAKKEHEELEAFAKERGHSGGLMHWDIAFWSERLREHLFDFTDEQLRPYFPLNRVIDGLFELCTRLFGVTFKKIDDEPSVWHADVAFYQVLDESGTHIASFYLDPYSRPAEKRGGAWMDKCMDRRWVDGDLRVPVVHLCCNGTPPAGDTPSLMSFREVETLFHEFGHGLQGMLTTVDYADVAGINGVEWDAVEIASQFMENWCYHNPTLLGMTAHFQTGEPLPSELFEKLKAARTFRAGSAMMRQLLFGSVDMALHGDFDVKGDKSPLDVYREYALEMATLPPLEEDRFLCSFSHIFAGGYAAGYYSYKWAEVLSADAFEAFEEIGLDNKAAVEELGRKYRDTILAQGGSRHPMEVFTSFRERPPSPQALLRHSGLMKNVTNATSTVIS